MATIEEVTVERPRQLWDAGIASGSAGRIDMTSLRKEGRARLEGRRTASCDSE